MERLNAQATEAAEAIRARLCVPVPETALILGSGLGSLAGEVEQAVVIPYRELPHFPVSTVEGHAGQLVIGQMEGVPVLVMQGRFHYYEGYSMAEVTFPIRVFAKLGVRRLLVTNAAGGIRLSFRPGDFMLIQDHILHQLPNPLIGPNAAEWGERFPDMSTAYSAGLRNLALQAAMRAGVRLHEGVYISTSGPSYETPAEIRALRSLGGDAVGMSTIPEVIVARHSGMEILAISCITNMAAGVLPQPLSHAEVIETSRRVEGDFSRLMRHILQEMKTRGDD